MITFTQFITFFMIALGLSFDSFAVSITMGMTRKKILFLQACQVAFVLAFFQALFPLGGWLVGSSLKNMIANYDHWVALGLLTFIGVRMILDGLGHFLVEVEFVDLGENLVLADHLRIQAGGDLK